jgi:hypothetical protein
VKYILNVPLALGAGAQALFAFYALMSGPWPGWEDGPSRGAMAYIMFEPAALSWLMLLCAALGAVFTDAFDWPPAARRGQRRAIVGAASLLIVVTLGVCMAVALGTSPAVASHDNDEFNGFLVAIARAGGIGGPLLAMGWLAWLIDAPPDRRHARLLRQPVLAVFALTTLAGGIIGFQMLREEIGVERKVAAQNKQMIDERETENLASLAQIDDNTPLREWLRLADPLQTDDIRKEALRRLATRPTLEADLAIVLQSDDTDQADAALRLVAELGLRPSAALAAPLRANFATLASRIDASRHMAGAGLDDPTYLDRWFGDQLAETLVATRNIADSAGVDLRDADRQLARAVSANYPTSTSAKTYPRDIAALDGRVDAAIAAHKGK